VSKHGLPSAGQTGGITTGAGGGGGGGGSGGGGTGAQALTANRVNNAKLISLPVRIG